MCASCICCSRSCRSRRVISRAIVACAAKSVTSSISFSVKGSMRGRPRLSDPISSSFLSIGTKRTVRAPLDIASRSPSSTAPMRSRYVATSGMWTGDLLPKRRPKKLSGPRSIGGDHNPDNAGPSLLATRRRTASSARRTPPDSARQRCTALSTMVSNMGCKSCGELAIARSTTEMAARCRRTSASSFCKSELL